MMVHYPGHRYQDNIVSPLEQKFEQIRLRLDEENFALNITTKVQLVPGTLGINAPSICTIVIIAGVDLFNFLIKNAYCVTDLF